MAALVRFRKVVAYCKAVSPSSKYVFYLQALLCKPVYLGGSTQTGLRAVTQSAKVALAAAKNVTLLAQNQSKTVTSLHLLRRCIDAGHSHKRFFTYLWREIVRNHTKLAALWAPCSVDVARRVQHQCMRCSTGNLGEKRMCHRLTVLWSRKILCAP